MYLYAKFAFIFIFYQKHKDESRIKQRKLIPLCCFDIFIPSKTLFSRHCWREWLPLPHNFDIYSENHHQAIYWWSLCSQSHQISTQFNTYGGFWTEALDSALHRRHQTPNERITFETWAFSPPLEFHTFWSIEAVPPWSFATHLHFKVNIWVRIEVRHGKVLITVRVRNECKSVQCPHKYSSTSLCAFLLFSVFFGTFLCLYYKRWRGDRKWGREKCSKNIHKKTLHLWGTWRTKIKLLEDSVLLNASLLHTKLCTQYTTGRARLRNLQSNCDTDVHLTQNVLFPSAHCYRGSSVVSVLLTVDVFSADCEAGAWFFWFLDSSFAEGDRRTHVAAWPSRMTFGRETNATITSICSTICSRVVSCGKLKKTQMFKCVFFNTRPMCDHERIFAQVSFTLLAIKVKINSGKEKVRRLKEFDRPWCHAMVFYSYTRVTGINSYNLNLTHWMQHKNVQ